MFDFLPQFTDRCHNGRLFYGCKITNNLLHLRDFSVAKRLFYRKNRYILHKKYNFVPEIDATAMNRRIIALCLFTLSLLSLKAEELSEDSLAVLRTQDDFVTASICIADPTDWHDDMLGILGHAFIRLQCPTFDMDYCFSYEGQSANDDIMGFIKGDLKMGLFAEHTQEYIKPYQKWNRTVREYKLNLPPEADLRLWEIMDQHVEEGIDLPLDLTEHGCAQTLIQYITQALDTTAIVYSEWPEEFRLSRYEMLDNSLEPYPWLRLMAKTLGMYGNFDQDCPNDEKIILPRQIVEVWQKATVNGKPLLTYKGDLTKGESPKVERPWFTPSIAAGVLVVLVLAIVVAVIRRRKAKSTKK